MMLDIVRAKYKFIDGGLGKEEKIAITCIYKTNLQQPLLRFLAQLEMCFFLASFCWPAISFVCVTKFVCIVYIATLQDIDVIEDAEIELYWQGACGN